MIKNYTSEVPISRSILHIEDRLVEFGARGIVKEYGGNGEIDALMFTIEDPYHPGKNMIFRVPVDVKAVEEVFIKKFPKKKLRTIKEQAPRTAWKLASDWIDIQMSFVEMKQVEFVQVFLSYMYDPVRKISYYHSLKANGFKMLEYKEDTP
jgi:hypothetical protein